MKFACLPILVLAVGCASPSRYAPTSTEAYFHSWYHGYYLHSVWGLGELEASSSEAFAICGDEKVAIKPVFDTHIWAGYTPKPGQTQEEATVHNQNLLARFSQRGVECRLPQPGTSAPN